MPLTAKVPSVVLYERPTQPGAGKMVAPFMRKAGAADTADRFEVVFSQFEDAWEGEDGGINLLAGRGHLSPGSVHFFPKEHAGKLREALGGAVKRERPKRDDKGRKVAEPKSATKKPADHKAE